MKHEPSVEDWQAWRQADAVNRYLIVSVLSEAGSYLGNSRGFDE